MSSKSNDPRAVVLSFYDVCLRQSDVDLLNGPFWLNDEIIAFAYEYFLRRRFLDSAEKIGFLAPAVVQLTKFVGGSALDESLEPLKLRTKELIFFPINDNQSNEAAGGSHWSLLVYRRSDDSFHHFDSIGTSENKNIANSIATSVSSIVDCRKSNPNVFSVPSAKQRNGYDCGVFCILFTEKLAEAYQKSEFPDLRTIGDKEILDYRKNLISLIDRLRSEENR